LVFSRKRPVGGSVFHDRLNALAVGSIVALVEESRLNNLKIKKIVSIFAFIF
jgi:hypothetical protein